MSLRFRYTSNTNGAAAPIFAVSLMAIVGLVGASLALGMDGRAAGNLQITADSAALAGATAFVAATSPRVEDRLAEAAKTANATAETNAHYFLTDLDIAPLTEDAYGQHTEIQVSLGFSPVNPAANLTGRNASIDIQRTAVAAATWGFPLCILALAENDIGLTVSGNADVIADNCIIWSNADSQSSMDFSGGSARAKFFCASGKARVSNTIVTPRPHEDCSKIPDPLADWVAPLPPGAEVYGTPSRPTEPVSRDREELADLLDDILLNTSLGTMRVSIRDALLAGEPLDEMNIGLFITQTQTSRAPTGGGDDDDDEEEDDENPGAGGQPGDLLLAELTSGAVSGLIVTPTGKIVNGPAGGMTVIELAQFLGVIDNLPAVELETESYVDRTTDTLKPGAYRGLDISKGNIELQPGVYHIVDEPFIVRRKATIHGEGVTFVFHGEGATFSILDQARLSLTAPSTGPTAGFILAQDRLSTKPSTTIRSRLTGSGSIEAIGTIYLPQHKLAITGDGAADQTSPLLQIVADEVEIADKGSLNIVFDPGKTDIPLAIAPAREARLIR